MPSQSYAELFSGLDQIAEPGDLWVDGRRSAFPNWKGDLGLGILVAGTKPCLPEPCGIFKKKKIVCGSNGCIYSI